MQHQNNRLSISRTGNIKTIDISTIVKIEAVSNYSRIYTSDGKRFLVSKVLKELESKLEGKGFARISRSLLVNTACVQGYNFHQLRILLYNKEQVSISRRRTRHVRERLRERHPAGIHLPQLQSAL